MLRPPTSADPATIGWMAGFKRRVLQSNGFVGRRPSCLEAEVCPGPALSDFLVRGAAKPTEARIRAPWRRCRRTTCARWRRSIPKTGEVGHIALLSFGIRAQSLEDQQALIDRMRG